ncbi:MAG TPA: penicillin-binding protein 2, partial [Gammaproteobacteria bacterium]|nr:penicillin-binding protein 2 [Gammaproteobacteria bacterium]
VLNVEPPTPGQDLYLTLDIRLQKAAQEAMGDYKGAVVAVDPRTGEVLALVSQPAFDPNWFVEGISYDNYAELTNNPRQPLFNRFLNGHYPPGSTIKPFLALGGLNYGVEEIHHRSFCSGAFVLEGNPRPYRCWKESGHGWVDLHDAIAQSCDVFFYELAVAMGIDRIHDFLALFGLGKPTGIDLVGEFSGLLPSREWKRRNRGLPWYPGETVITGIGQGFMLTTPLQLAQATAALASRGKTRRLHLLDSHQGVNGKRVADAAAPFPEITVKKQQYWESVIQAMHDVVQGPRGTARATGIGAPYAFAGKSGTAQVFTLEKGQEYNFDELAVDLRDHGLFVAFAPLKDPRIAVAVVVENGGGGSSVAAPVARAVMDAWLLELTPHDGLSASKQPTESAP